MPTGEFYPLERLIENATALRKQRQRERREEPEETRVLTTLLFGVTEHDPLVFAARVAAGPDGELANGLRARGAVHFVFR